NDYYCIPNSVVPKRERSQWRFTVLRLFKNINHAATREANVAKAAELLEKLYVMLCYSCRYTLFSAYDSFQSVGVSQEDFFRVVPQLIMLTRDLPRNPTRTVPLNIKDASSFRTWLDYAFSVIWLSASTKKPLNTFISITCGKNRRSRFTCCST